MITDLRDKPRRCPAYLPPRIADKFFEILAVEFAGQCASGVQLIRIAFALMPEHSAESTRLKLLHSRDEHFKGFTFAFPIARRQLLHATGDRGRIRKFCALRQPLAHARCPDAAGDETNWHNKTLRHGITEWRQKTSAATARARLRIVGELPAFAVERGNLAGLRALLFLAVIGGVGLASDNKHLAHADVLDRCLTNSFVTVQSPHF